MWPDTLIRPVNLASPEDRMHPVALLLAGACAPEPVSVPVAEAPTPGPVFTEVSLPQASDRWFEGGRAALEGRLDGLSVPPQRAKNLVLFVGDGMNASTVAAARVLAGQRNGELGEDHALSFERFPHLALVKTYNADYQIPDSAGTMSALMTGVKANISTLSVREDVGGPGCEGLDAAMTTTLLELADAQGRATGIVSNTRITHATPAATYAHSPSRGYEGDWHLPEGSDCVDLAKQLVTVDAGDGLEVVLGGGWGSMLPEGTAPPGRPVPEGEDAERWQGQRTGGEDLTQVWAAQPGAAVVWDRTTLKGIQPGATRHLLGLFSPSHMPFEFDHTDATVEPTLVEMTAAALSILQTDPDGYVLMVEGGRIDHAHHYGNASRALDETIHFADAVAHVLSEVDLANTLVLVTADHGHAFATQGHPIRGNPILGLVHHADQEGNRSEEPATDKYDQPYTTLAYVNGPGGIEPEGGWPTLTEEAVTDPDYLQRAAVPSDHASHSLEDVPLYATGAGSAIFGGVMDQHVVFHGMIEALGWRPVDPEPSGDATNQP